MERNSLYKRHNLIFASSNAGVHIDETDDLSNLEHAVKARLGLELPAIVKRQSQSDATHIEVGFSTPYYQEDNRLRFSGTIANSAIEKVYTPFQVAEGIVTAFKGGQMPEFNHQYLAVLKLVYELFTRASVASIELGVFGSVALQWVTGAPYYRTESDLDLYLKAKPDADLNGFYQYLKAQEETIKIDAELEYQEHDKYYGIKLKELFGQQKTVLGKGLYTIEMFLKERVWNHIWN